jgi:hypothetical protein
MWKCFKIGYSAVVYRELSVSVLMVVECDIMTRNPLKDINHPRVRLEVAFTAVDDGEMKRRSEDHHSLRNSEADGAFRGLMEWGRSSSLGSKMSSSLSMSEAMRESASSSSGEGGGMAAFPLGPLFLLACSRTDTMWDFIKVEYTGAQKFINSAVSDQLQAIFFRRHQNAHDTPQPQIENVCRFLF